MAEASQGAKPRLTGLRKRLAAYPEDEERSASTHQDYLDQCSEDQIQRATLPSTSDLTIESILERLQGPDVPVQLRKQLETLSRQQAPFEPLARIKQQRLEQGLRYKERRRNLGKWMPLIASAAVKEQAAFGVIPSDVYNTKTTSSLAATMTTATTFEKELNQALKESNITQKLLAEDRDELPDQPQDQSAHQSKVAQLKSLLFREHRKRKQLARIKSKNWRKMNRHRKLLEDTKMLSQLKLKSPELFEKLGSDLEQKRAAQRIMKAQHARRKWGRLALRFGGKELQKTVSMQHQTAIEERRALESVLKKVYLTGAESDSDSAFNSDDTDNDNDNDDDDDDTARKLTKMKKKVWFEEPSGEHGSTTQAAPERISLSENMDDGDVKRAPTPQPKPSDDPKRRFRSAIMNLPFMQRALEKDKQETQLFLEEGEVSENVDVTPDDSYPRQNEADVIPPKFSLANPSSLTPSASVSTQLPIDSLIESEEGQRALLASTNPASDIQEVFVNQASEEVFIEDTKSEPGDVSATKPKGLPGWNSWTDCTKFQASCAPQPSETSTLTASEPIRQILVPRQWSKKISAYMVEKLPHPYMSKEAFQQAQAHPLGQEFNTSQVHQRLIQPKVYTRPGHVILPLEYAKHRPTAEIESMITAWTSNKKRKPTQARL